MDLQSLTGGISFASSDDWSCVSLPQPAVIPSQLVYPLSQRNGLRAKSLVLPGSRVLAGQMLTSADNALSPPVHAATSGQVLAIESRLLPQSAGLKADCIVIQPDGLDEAMEYHGVADYAAETPQQLCERIHAAGIVGLGGAGFSTAHKLNPKNRLIDTLILNGAECEPYIRCDDSLLTHYPERVLQGANILLHILGAERCLLAVEENKPEAIAILQKAGQKGGYPRVDIVTVPTIYPSGGEKQLIQIVTGREVPTQGLPADIGVICQNVATATAVYQAIVNGEPLLSRIVTVTGAGVKQPQNRWVRIGTPIAELIEQCGGYTDDAQRLIIGGPMMGFAVETDALPITKTSNCIFVAGREALTAHKSIMPCIRCGECAAVCPASLLPQQLHWHQQANNLEKLVDYHIGDCIECGCCDYVCPSQIPLTQSFRAMKDQLAVRQFERLQAAHARARFDAKQARKEREKQEKAESIRRKKALLDKAAAGTR